MGDKSDLLISLAITTTQSLKGSAQHFNYIESKTRINKGVINQLSLKLQTKIEIK